MSTSIIVPFHRNLADLDTCLTAIRRAAGDAELIVAADGAREDYGPVVRRSRASVVVVPGPSGPAVARNRAADAAQGDIFVFVDADVEVSPDAIDGLVGYLDAHPDIAGVFGAYDEFPRARNFISQFKNLSHSYVHQIGKGRASTFWAGLGAVRAAAFRHVGGFDERFTRPSVEDIDLGYRLVAAGYAIELEPRFRGCHLKRWSLASCVRTDIQARGIPWTQLIHRRGAVSNDLNTTTALRASVAVSYLLVASLALAFWTRWALVSTAAFAVLLVALNLDYYRWFARTRGLAFACGVFPVHVLHHLCNGVSFIAGTALHHAARLGLRLPGSLPVDNWTGPLRAPQSGTA